MTQPKREDEITDEERAAMYAERISIARDIGEADPSDKDNYLAGLCTGRRLEASRIAGLVRERAAELHEKGLRAYDPDSGIDSEYYDEIKELKRILAIVEGEGC
jgi:cellulose biosynthesis protein BcsQ